MRTLLAAIAIFALTGTPALAQGGKKDKGEPRAESHKGDRDGGRRHRGNHRGHGTGFSIDLGGPRYRCPPYQRWSYSRQRCVWDRY